MELCLHPCPHATAHFCLWDCTTLCGYPTYLRNNPTKINKLGSCGRKLLKTNALEPKPLPWNYVAREMQHDQKVWEKDSQVWERKVKVESSKPGHCSRMSTFSSLYLLFPTRSSSWTTEQGCVNQSTWCLLLSKIILTHLPSPVFPSSSGLHLNPGLSKETLGLRAFLGDFTQHWT